MKRQAVMLVAVGVLMLLATPMWAHGHGHGRGHGCGNCGHCMSWGPGPQAGPGTGPGGAGWQRGPQGRGPAAGQPMYDPKTVTTLRGTVKSFELVPEGPGQLGGYHLTLDVGGKTTVVHLGPAWFVDKGTVKPAKGDTVEVTGSMVGKDEGSYVIAREVKKDDKVLTLRNEHGIPAWAGGPRR